MLVRVLLFGPAAAAIGRGDAAVEVAGGGGCGALRAALEAAFPALRPALAAGRFAINSEFAGEDQPIREGDEVALISLVSGG